MLGITQSKKSKKIQKINQLFLVTNVGFTAEIDFGLQDGFLCLTNEGRTSWLLPVPAAAQQPVCTVVEIVFNCGKCIVID